MPQEMPLPPGGPTRPARLALDEREVLRLGNLSLRRELLQSKLQRLECDEQLLRLQVLGRYGVPPDEAARWRYDPVGGCSVQRGTP